MSLSSTGITGRLVAPAVLDCGIVARFSASEVSFSESYGRLPHNFVPNVGSKSRDEEVEGDVIVAILDTKVDKVDSDLGTDSDVSSDNLR